MRMMAMIPLMLKITDANDGNDPSDPFKLPTDIDG